MSQFQTTGYILSAILQKARTAENLKSWMKKMTHFPANVYTCTLLYWNKWTALPIKNLIKQHGSRVFLFFCKCREAIDVIASKGFSYVIRLPCRSTFKTMFLLHWFIYYSINHLCFFKSYPYNLRCFIIEQVKETTLSFL